MRAHPISIVLVAIQLVAIAALALSGPLLPHALLPLVLVLSGIALGVWALLAMGLRNLRIVPEPSAARQLQSGGPYRWIRHPMYDSVLLVTLGWLIAAPGAARALGWLILCLDLLIKLRREERILTEALPGYRAYRLRTYRLVPFVF